ncbi:hypothetical protein D3C80_1739100 [compost metagenome]
MIRVGQGAAQGFDHLGLFPGFEQARRFSTHLIGRIIAQGVHQPRQVIRIFKVSQFDQGNAAHASICMAQAWQQVEDLGVIAIECIHMANRGLSLSSGSPSGVRRGSCRPS